MPGRLVVTSYCDYGLLPANGPHGRLGHVLAPPADAIRWGVYSDHGGDGLTVAHDLDSRADAERIRAALLAVPELVAEVRRLRVPAGGTVPTGYVAIAVRV